MLRAYFFQDPEGSQHDEALKKLFPFYFMKKKKIIEMPVHFKADYNECNKRVTHIGLCPIERNDLVYIFHE